MTATRLSMSGVHKCFGPTRALDGIDLELAPGEIHALVGENGAGKSTLMKVLSGAIYPDAGKMTLDGQAYGPADPRDARRRGVGMIYQELNLAPDLDVEANILLGIERSTLGFLHRRGNRERVRAALAELHHPEITPETPIASLGPGARQLVEIARALVFDVKVLVLDEPTSALTQEDSERLFGLMRHLRDRGVTIVYISHFLEEVEKVCDRYSVLRDGRRIGTGTRSDFSRDRVIEQMVGRRLTEQYPRVPHVIGEPVLELKGITGMRLPNGVDLILHKGEIFGLAGIMGAGRTELIRAVFGLDVVRSGHVKVHSVSSHRGTPAERIRQGIGLLSEDRKSEGLALAQSTLDNLTYSRLNRYSRFGLLRLTKLRQAASDWLQRLNVRHGGLDRPVGELSGGNQQKVALGRLLHQEADVLLLDEPTKGVDVGSKVEIYRLIGGLAAQGKSVLLASNYLPELFGICDRVGVMCRGRLMAVRPASAWQPEQVIGIATGST